MIKTLLILLLTAMVCVANIAAVNGRETGDAVSALIAHVWFAALALIAYLELRKLL